MHHRVLMLLGIVDGVVMGYVGWYSLVNQYQPGLAMFVLWLIVITVGRRLL